MRRCFLDVDGTVADLVTPLAAALGKPDLRRENWPATYALSEALQVPIERIEAIFHEEDFWTDLPLLPWASDLVEHLLARFGEGNVAFLTAIPTPDHHVAASGKSRWLREKFPGVPVFVGPRTKHLVSAPGHVLIDDHEATVSKWTDHGGHGVLLPAPWNLMRGKVVDERIVDYVRGELDAIAGKRWVATPRCLHGFEFAEECPECAP